MEIFTHEFKSFLLRNVICSWRGHKKGKWQEVYWAPAHSSGYRSRFCQVCSQELETTKGKKLSFSLH